MTYQVLARKWRPKNFAQLIGQSAVSKALMYALEANRLHHAYLFTGTRGIGKTTIARILAKCFNCEKGVQSEPCNVCSTCLEIDAGCSPDFLEVDAASRTRIEDTKELLDNVVYAPLRGRYKIYLIDEVHMLSGHSFNALLKTLEEPPEHVKFIFATTEPHRIPVTVLSRCLHFNLRPLTTLDLENQLKHILSSENISFEDKALQLLAKAAKGSSRDCLSLLEQAIGIGQGQLKSNAVADMLGLSDHALIPTLMEAICAHNITGIFDITSQLAQSGADFERILELLLESLQALNMMQMVPDAQKHIDHLKEVDEAILALHTQLTPEQTQLYYQIALLGKRDLSIMPDLGKAFEMVLLRMMCFQLTPHASKIEATPLLKPAVQAPIQPAVQAPIVKPGISQVPQAPVVSPVSPAPIAKEIVKPKEAAPMPSNQIPNWRELISKLSLGAIVKLLAQHCVIQKWALPQVQLVLEAAQQPFFSPEREKELSEALTKYFNTPVYVSITLQAHSAVSREVSPAMQVQAEQNEKQTKAQALLAKEEMVQTLMDVFDAKLMKLTITDDP